MDLFRLTYFNTSKDVTDKWKATYRFEVYGSGEAICDLYRSLSSLAELTDACVPRFLEIYNKDESYGRVPKKRRPWRGVQHLQHIQIACVSQRS